MSEGQPPVPPAPTGGVPAPGVLPAAVSPGDTEPLPGGVLSTPPVALPTAVVPAPTPGVLPAAEVGSGGTAPLPGGALSSPPVAAVPAPAAIIPAPSADGTVAPVTEGNSTLAEPEQPFFSVMLLDGQPIEFPVEMTGFEQDFGQGPVILQPNGRGVETTRKLDFPNLALW